MSSAGTGIALDAHHRQAHHHIAEAPCRGRAARPKAGAVASVIFHYSTTQRRQAALALHPRLHAIMLMPRLLYDGCVARLELVLSPRQESVSSIGRPHFTHDRS